MGRHHGEVLQADIVRLEEVRLMRDREGQLATDSMVSGV